MSSTNSLLGQDRFLQSNERTEALGIQGRPAFIVSQSAEQLTVLVGKNTFHVRVSDLIPELDAAQIRAA
jgi:protein-disulfide isomerase-like protein with CxxC motif